MWARVVEFMLACWLAISPFIFLDSSAKEDLTCSLFIALFALLSFAKRLNKIHLLNLLVALWLIVVGHGARMTLPLPAHQNQLILGLLLSMLALVPTDSEKPPHSWRSFQR